MSPVSKQRDAALFYRFGDAYVQVSWMSAPRRFRWRALGLDQATVLGEGLHRFKAKAQALAEAFVRNQIITRRSA